MVDSTLFSIFCHCTVASKKSNKACRNYSDKERYRMKFLRYSSSFLTCTILAPWTLIVKVTVNAFSTARLVTPSSTTCSPNTPLLYHLHNAATMVAMEHQHRPHRGKKFNSNQNLSSNVNDRRRCSSSTMLYVVPNDVTSNTFWISVVEYFDGSTIVDPVVVSNVFWSRLQANLISVIIGQFLAAIVFSFLLSTATSQITKLLSYVSEQLFTTSSTTQRDNQSSLRIPRTLRDDTSTSSSTVPPDFGKLLICILIDSIGSSSMLLPLIGDASDVLWAPTAGLLLRYLFYNSNVILVFEFAEEILPFTDILPLATLCWIIDTYFRETDIAKLLQLGVYASSSPSSVTKNIDRTDAIDVDSTGNIRDGRSK